MSVLAPLIDFKGTESYRLSADLADVTRSRALTWSEPGEADQDELLLSKLGVRGWGRLHHFRMLYQAGWGDGAGKPASPRAVQALVSFLDGFNLPEGVTPSLFLTDRGGIELAWEEAGGAPVQVEFHRDGIEVYREAAGVEKEFAPDQAATAARLLANGSRG
jgi:hypothetical protein